MTDYNFLNDSRLLKRQASLREHGLRLVRVRRVDAGRTTLAVIDVEMPPRLTPFPNGSSVLEPTDGPASVPEK